MDTAALKDSWELVAKSGDEVPLYFYSHLFLTRPDLRSMFPISMANQRDKLVGALGRIVSNVDQLDDVTEFIQQLGRDHRRFAVVAEHYNAVGASLLATLSKAVGFVVLVGLLGRVFTPYHELLTRGLLVIAAITVLWGNMGALKQTDLTRVLGYSSIAHSGYLLLATSSGSTKAESAIIFYLVQYSFTNIAAFFALGNVVEHGGTTTLESLARKWSAAGALAVIRMTRTRSGWLAKYSRGYMAPFDSCRTMLRAWERSSSRWGTPSPRQGPTSPPWRSGPKTRATTS